MKKNVPLVAMAVLSVFGFTSCNKNNSAPSAPVVLTMAEVNPEDSVCGRMDTFFKNKVSELSDGRITVDISFSGSRGDESHVINLMMSGDSSIQLARTSANLSNYGVGQSALITIPYTFSNPDHFWKFAKSDIARSILEEPYMQGLGVRGLCYAEEGFRHFFSTEKISSLKNLKGKKMRVSGKNLTSLAQALEADAKSVPFTELYMALQTGAVEVAEQPVANYLSNSFYQVAPYMIMDKHMLGAVQILISSSCWDSLSEEDRNIISTAAQESADYCRFISDEQEVNAAIKLVSEGVTIVEVADMTPWQKACEKLIKENSQNYPELYQQILDLAK